MESNKDKLIQWFAAEYPEREKEWRSFLDNVPVNGQNASYIISLYEETCLPDDRYRSTTFSTVKTRGCP